MIQLEYLDQNLNLLQNITKSNCKILTRVAEYLCRILLKNFHIAFYKHLTNLGLLNSEFIK